MATVFRALVGNKFGTNQGQAFSHHSIRQLFQNILDLFFIVEHTHIRAKCCTHNYKSFFWEKSSKKTNKTKQKHPKTTEDLQLL